MAIKEEERIRKYHVVTPSHNNFRLSVMHCLKCVYLGWVLRAARAKQFHHYPAHTSLEL